MVEVISTKIPWLKNDAFDPHYHWDNETGFGEEEITEYRDEEGLEDTVTFTDNAKQFSKRQLF